MAALHTPMEEFLRLVKSFYYSPTPLCTMIRSPPPDGEFVASDQVSRSFSRRFNETKGRRLQPYLTELTDALKVYDISCQLTVQVIKYISGSFAEDILTGYQEGGLCSKYRIDQKQFSEPKRYLSGSLQELGRLMGCDIWHGATRVIIVGTLQGSRLAREVVEDCIVRNVPLRPKSETS